MGSRNDDGRLSRVPRLVAAAHALGLDCSAYAARVLEQAVPAKRPARKRTLEDFGAFLDAIAEGSETLPLIATEDFARESFYSDRG